MKWLVNILSKSEERLTFDVCCSIRHRLREIAMSNFAFGVPVKTRLPLKVWTMAAIVTLFSLLSSMMNFHAAPNIALYAGAAAEHGISRGS